MLVISIKVKKKKIMTKVKVIFVEEKEEKKD